MELALRTTVLVTAGLTAVASVVAGAIGGIGAAVATIGGGAAAIANYFLLVRDVERLTTAVKPHVYRAFPIRYFLMGGILFAMIALLKLSPAGVIVGVTMIVPGVVVGTLVGWKN